MYYEILDKKRRKALPLLQGFKKDFYLGGGTALALQIGHRDSIDFDFFSTENIDTTRIFSQIEDSFLGKDIVKTEEEKNTLTVFIENSVKISFFTYRYPLIKNTKKEKYLELASVEDIGCMKLSAITSRAANKDYIDIYYILKEVICLEELLALTRKKFPQINTNLILKSLVYFKDVEIEPIMFKENKEVDFSEVKEFLIEKVKEVQFRA